MAGDRVAVGPGHVAARAFVAATNHQRRSMPMRSRLVSIVSLALLTYCGSASSADQAAIDAHVTAARKAAGEDYGALLKTLCTPATKPRPAAANPPDRSTWAAEPAKVFDNLYFVGQAEHSAWA